MIPARQFRKTGNAPIGTQGMTLVELAFVLMVLGGLGWGGMKQFLKLKMRIKAIEVKVLVNELDQIFDHQVSEYGLSLPIVQDDNPIGEYRNVAKVAAGEIPSVPNGESETFDFLLGSSVDAWKLTVVEKGKSKEVGFLMSCGYQFTSRGAVEMNEESPWANYLRPTCLVADKAKEK